MDLEHTFEEIITQYKGVVYKACYIYADNKEDVNDLFQEVLINIWKGLPKFREQSSISTWVYRVSINTCISFIRKNKKRPSMVAFPINLFVPEEGSDIERQISELYSVINRLGQLEKALIWLWLEERDYDEIAEITGLSKSNVGVKLMRIKDKIKSMFNE